jgi:uncharacterized protein YbcI
MSEAFHDVGLFRFPSAPRRMKLMEKLDSIAQQIAKAASAFEQLRTGHFPNSVTVVLTAETLVITLHGVLSRAEREAAKTPDGAAKVLEFHRQLFASSSEPLRQEIERITGTGVCQADGKIESAAVVPVFPAGAIVQVFVMAEKLPTEIWSGKPTIPELEEPAE